MFPTFQVTERVPTETPGILGKITRTTHAGQPWVGDRWLGFLMAEGRLVAGRWYQRGDLWEFGPDHVDDLATITARPEWDVLEGYWGEGAELVLDQARRWTKERVQPRDAIRVQGPGGVWLRPVTDSDDSRARLFPGDEKGPHGDGSRADVIGAGWDHEHCAICWQTLGPGGQADGYVSDRRVWECERCYLNFVERR